MLLFENANHDPRHHGLNVYSCLAKVYWTLALSRPPLLPRGAGYAVPRGPSEWFLPLPTLEAGQLLPKVPLHLAHLVARGVGEQRPRFYLGQLHLITAAEFNGTSRVLEDSSKLGR